MQKERAALLKMVLEVPEVLYVMCTNTYGNYVAPPAPLKRPRRNTNGAVFGSHVVERTAHGDQAPGETFARNGIAFEEMSPPPPPVIYIRTVWLDMCIYLYNIE